MKRVLIAATVIVVVIIVGILLLLSNLNTLVARAIEKHGSEVTETSVTVTGVKISLRKGRGSIRGLSIANPDGFDRGVAFTLGDITVDIDPASLTREPLVIEEIRIAVPVVNAVIAGDGSTNIDRLRKNILAHTPAAAATDDDEEGGAAEARRIRIKQFVFERGSVSVDGSALGIEARTIDLPEIRIEEIGGAQGMLPDEVTMVALTALVKQVGTELAASQIKQLIKDNLGDLTVDEAIDEAKGLLDKLGN
ncbi:MAG: hypothetical protein GY835_10745 [bacterium]|nr:hypothetical protein [bacterium]